MIGRIVSRYRIVERIGRGGMGVVYKARDLRLDRFAALKFLSTVHSGDDQARERFLREARAASALDHPNICTIFGIEDTDDGEMFIAMPCYEGEDLRHRLDRGPLGVAEAVNIARQLAEALAKAHEHGIVHRDVKPANVMLTSDGGVKLMDFGIALLGGSVQTTRPGTAMGTPGYMSPEQCMGRQCDVRTDVWSWGVMLYEMLAGELPFRATGSRSITEAIAQDEPRWPRAVRPEVPEPVDWIVRRAMEKEPERRYQTARDLAASLRSRTGDTAGSGASDTMTLVSMPSAGPVPLALSLLVLPFGNLSNDPDNEYFADGLTEELITDLGQIPGFRVVSRNSAFQFKGKPADARKLGDDLRVNNILEGSVRKAGDRLRITAQLVNARDGYQIWSERFDRRMEDVFAIQDEIVLNIVTALRAKLTGNTPAPVPARRRAENLEAYNLYLQGRFHWNRQTPDGLPKAAELYGKAIEIDPNYAAAWAGLADYYFAIGFWSVAPPETVWPEARRHAERAVELDPGLTHAQTAMGYVRIFCNWDWTEAGRNFRRAVELNPGDSQAAYAHAVYLTQTNHLDEALAEFRRALDLDPLAMNLNTALAMMHYYRREYPQAIAQARKTLGLDPNYFEMRAGLGLIYLQTSRFDEGVECLEQVRAQSGENPLIMGLLGYGYGVAGRDEDALKIIARLEELAAAQYVAPISRALPFIGLGKHDDAFQWMEKAAEAHDALLCYLDVMPCYDPLRHDPRFGGLAARIGLGGSGSNVAAGADLSPSHPGGA